jgi:hypothetical protein
MGDAERKRVSHYLWLVSRFVKDRGSTDVRRGREASCLVPVLLIFMKKRGEKWRQTAPTGYPQAVTTGPTAWENNSPRVSLMLSQ